MPRGRVGIHSVYIADGFADDCENLIHLCSGVKTLSYQHFCKFYKELNFASLYQGRTSNAEIGELSEEVLQIAKYYMVLETSNFEATVAGLFLVYALLNLQPYSGFAPLRITPQDLPALARIEKLARRERRLDVLYVLGSLLIKGPVHYHVVGRERGLEAPLRKYLEVTSILDITGVRPKGVYFRQNEELDMLRDLTGFFKRYSQEKEEIKALQKHGVKYSNDDLALNLGTSLKALINGIVDYEDPDPKDHYNAVQEIKYRAMRSAINRLKHLEACEDRLEDKSPKKAEDTEQPSKSTTSPKTTPKKKTKCKRRRHVSSSSSSSSEGDFKCFSEEDEKSKKPYVSRASRSFVDETKEESHRQPDEQEINVHIDSLPPLITTESDGKLVEIEIIDEMIKTDEVAKGNVKKKETPKKTKEKTDDEVFKRPLRMSPRLKVATRREMKQPILKSKFKKMGMLDIADLSVTNAEKPPHTASTIRDGDS